MALIKGKECGKEYSDNASACPKCGNPTIEEKNNDVEQEHQEEIKTENIEKSTEISEQNQESKKGNKIIVGVIVGASIIIAILVIVIVLLTKADKNDKAIRVDITMNSWYGSIEYILEDFGIEFYAVTSGANCFSGVKTNSFETEKYGTLYTEFTYCKSNNIQRFRIYNKSKDQELREPKTGEINSYDSLGYRKSSLGTGV